MRMSTMRRPAIAGDGVVAIASGNGGDWAGQYDKGRAST